MARRHWLVLGTAGLVLSAATRVTAAGPAQIEAEGYGGSSVGSWTCGPTARATYGGVGGNARIYLEDQEPRRVENEDEHTGPLEPDPEGPPSELPQRSAHDERQSELDDTPNLEPHGLWIGGGGGAENRSFTRLACTNNPCGANDVVPPTRFLGAGRLGMGYDWDYFGMRAGVMAFSYWQDNTDKTPTTQPLPEAEFRFGRRAGFHGGFGFGAYDVSTMFRPGGFLTVGYASGRVAADLRGGVNLVFDGATGGRVDASFRYGITRFVAPGFGVALSSVKTTTPEGRLFLVFTP